MVAIQVDIALIVQVVAIQVIVEVHQAVVIHIQVIEEVLVVQVHQEVHRQVSEVIITKKHIDQIHSHHRLIQELQLVSIKCI